MAAAIAKAATLEVSFENKLYNLLTQRFDNYTVILSGSEANIKNDAKIEKMKDAFKKAWVLAIQGEQVHRFPNAPFTQGQCLDKACTALNGTAKDTGLFFRNFTPPLPGIIFS